MAYLDVREDYAGLSPLISPRTRPLFERLEWNIIALAARDGLDSLRAPGRSARILGWLFGTRPERRMANPRLEALRRLAVLAWHHSYAVPTTAIEAFLDAGFSAEQLELLLSSVASRRSSRRVRA